MRKRAKLLVSPALYNLYESRVERDLERSDLPRHIGVIVDGNRRWAKEMGFEVSAGHRRGGEKLTDLVRWSEELGIEVVTIWLLSTDNLSRDPGELGPLLETIVDVTRSLSDSGHDWQVRVMGTLDLLPAEVAGELKSAAASTEGRTGTLCVNVAVGYGGRREIVDAVRSVLGEAVQRGATLEEMAEQLDLEHIAAHLYTKGQPDPDLIIRTSGEQRLGGFLLWQTAHSEFYFSDVFWPDFRRVDFLRAVRAYASRHRRFGS